jgi:hypothetical protein
MRWQILTGEYPPGEGGVADYTELVAHGLVAVGDTVNVWAPQVDSRVDPAGVVVHGLPDHYGPRSLALLGRAFAASQPPHRLLVQYVPHAFGWKGGNVAFCLWLRSQTYAPVWVMFHEVAYPIGRRQRLVENALGVVTRGMAALVASSAERAFVSIPAWEPMLRQAASPSLPIQWMPVPSAIAIDQDDAAVAAVRNRYGGARPVIGHFGTFGRLIQPLLLDALRAVLHRVDASVLLIGRGSDQVAGNIGRRWPELREGVAGAGVLDARGVSHHVAACDIMLQPYPDGVSSRRTSVMVALAHGRRVVTTCGPLTEPLWDQAPGIVACAVGDTDALVRECSAALTMSSLEAASQSAAVRALYASQFDVRHTIAMLRAPDLPSSAVRKVS